MTTPAARQPAGVPIGGQFAATSHSEPSVSLESSEPRTAAGILATNTDFVTLIYIERDDNLTEDQIDMALAGQWNDVENAVDDVFRDHADEVARETAEREFNEAFEEGKFDREWDELDDDEQDEAIQAIRGRDPEINYDDHDEEAGGWPFHSQQYSSPRRNEHETLHAPVTGARHDVACQKAWLDDEDSFRSSGYAKVDDFGVDLAPDARASSPSTSPARAGRTRCGWRAATTFRCSSTTRPTRCRWLPRSWIRWPWTSTSTTRRAPATSASGP